MPLLKNLVHSEDNMTAKILYGKEFAAKIKESARLEVEELKNKLRRKFTFAINIKLVRNSA